MLVHCNSANFHTSIMAKYTTQKLSDPEVRHAKPKEKLYRLRDGGGLSCDVLPTGTKTWRYAYRFNGKQRTVSLGHYPIVGLSDARKKRDAAKEKVNAGIDPSLEKQALRYTSNETSFHAIAEEWSYSQMWCIALKRLPAVDQVLA